MDGSSVNNRSSVEEVKPPFVDLLAAFERKLEQQAQQAELLVKAQQLREEGEILLQSGETQTASFKFEAALKLLETARGLDPSGIPLQEFQYKLKDKLQEALIGPFDNTKDLPGVPLLQETLDQEVHRFVRYFQGPGKESFERTSRRSASYRGMIERIFTEEGLPTELVFLAQIESGFDSLALSSANARGLWQFIPETGRRYGLHQTVSVDERSDPVRSTRAAARYLKDLYAQFKNWPLALAAYNAGEKRIADLISKTGFHDFWTLSRLKLLPKETTAYVPAVLASISLHHPEAKGVAARRMQWTKGRSPSF
jgi:transglycosylase-like protein with SLT domain